MLLLYPITEREQHPIIIGIYAQPVIQGIQEMVDTVIRITAQERDRPLFAINGFSLEKILKRQAIVPQAEIQGRETWHTHKKLSFWLIGRIQLMPHGILIYEI